MPKPMLNTQNQVKTTIDTGNLSATKQENGRMKNGNLMDKMKLDRLLRNRRSEKYIKAMRELDAGGHVNNQDQVNKIIDTIKNELPEVEISDVLLGIVSICYLGKPYEVHTLDISGRIIQHYKAGQPLPGELEKARSIALHGGYEFIEVYASCCRCVSSSGAVSVVEG